MAARLWNLSRSAVLASLLAALISAPPARAQQLGHKVLGSAGMFAGSQPDSGLYVVYQFASYGSNEIFDRVGHSIPVPGLDLDASTNVFGLQFVFRLTHSLYFNVTAAGPISQISANAANPEASVDDFGLGDIYVQPIKLGWKWRQADLVAGYAFYAPTGLYVPHASGSVGLGQWTHEFSLGTAVWFDRAKTWSLSVLNSYELHQRKEGIDITRGDNFQFQGGTGKTFRPRSQLLPRVDLGAAGYGLWQVRDDRGADLPAALRGARDLDFGLGPELGIVVAPVRGRVTLRYVRDVTVKSRPLGHVFLVQLTILARR